MRPDGEFTYTGSELQLFAHAHRWKAYLARQVAPFIGRSVLEIGAGLGATTRALYPRAPVRWVCMEPDPKQAAEILAGRKAGVIPTSCEVVVGRLDRAPVGTFDTILYIDVLEHIEHDDVELAAAAERLDPGGHLVVLSPAHQSLFSEFDRQVGHYRRYTVRTLAAVAPRSLRLVRFRYLDSLGAVASVLNRLVLHQRLPTGRQIAFWNRLLVPPSRYLDWLTGYRIGRTLLAVWTR
jgi:SAM-dependent methyltransferase